MGKFVLKATATGFVFNLKANNGQTIATSQVYSSQEACEKGIHSVRVNSTAANIEDQTYEDYETQKNPKYEVYRDKKGEFRFRLQASNGEIIAVSEGYTEKVNAINGIESVRKNAPDADVTMENLV